VRTGLNVVRNDPDGLAQKGEVLLEEIEDGEPERRRAPLRPPSSCVQPFWERTLNVTVRVLGSSVVLPR
jgi:hypothetical protein